MTTQPQAPSDDQLGEAMRAFVDQSLSAGVEREAIIYALSIATIRLALDIAPSSSVALASILRTAADIAAIHARSSGPAAMSSTE